MTKSRVGVVIPAAMILILLMGSVSAQHLTITEKSEEWVDSVNKTYCITYTASNSGPSPSYGSVGVYIDNVLNKTEPVPEVGTIGPGECYTSTTGPFTMLDESDTIKVCILENNETYNCLENVFRIGPDLAIIKKSEEWLDFVNKTYNITYTLKNIGTTKANASTLSIYIDDVNIVNDSLPALNASESYTSTIGPFTMSEKKDIINVCADKDNRVSESNEDNNCMENVFEYPGGCVAEDGTVFTCGDNVTKSCTFDGNMTCELAHGLIIAADNITIDGNNFTLNGDTPGACTDGIEHSGIYNFGHNDAVIKNIEITNFCNGIYIGQEEEPVHNITIDHCEVHLNGNNIGGDTTTQGIKLGNVCNSTISNNKVHHNIGKGEAWPDGGDGIYLREGYYNLITGNELYNNSRSGFLIFNPTAYTTVTHNNVSGNGEGGIVLGTRNPVHYIIEHNNVSYNKGAGIYIGGPNNFIRYNTVTNNRNSTAETSLIGKTGVGIRIENPAAEGNVLINNMVCGNEYQDIAIDETIAGGAAGDENTCALASNYNDEGTVGCIYYCGAANGVCVGTTKNFTCGDTVTESCTFNRSISCPAGHGLIIGASNITIDGAGYTISSNSTVCTACTAEEPENSDCGILNAGHNNVAIKNLQVKGFCTGIMTKNVENNTIDNCNVRDNGDDTGLTHGIHLWNTDNSIVSNSRIYDNVGKYTGDMDTGGHGVKLCKHSDYNDLTNNVVCNNYASGIFSTQCQYNEFVNNTVNDNGFSASDFGGGIRLSRETDYWTVEHNIISNNTGPGIFVAGDNNTFKYNIVSGSKNGTLNSIKGHGIFLHSSANNNTMYSNSFGDNEGIDIYNDDGPSNTGDENRCETTYDYDDEGTSGCTYRYDIDLMITDKREEWVDFELRIYAINYTVKNIGRWEANVSTTSIRIDGEEIATDSVPALASNESYVNTVGPFLLSGGSARIMVCADRDNAIAESNEDNNCMENEFKYEEAGGGSGDNGEGLVSGVCVGATKNFGCGATVTESCTFNCSMNCPEGHGLIVGADDITIDGADSMFTINGIKPTNCSFAGEQTLGPRNGIHCDGYKDVVLKNMRIKNFCNGIGVKGNPSEKSNITIENCEVYYNGDAVEGSVTHGIKLVAVSYSIVTNCEIHDNTGIGDSCGSGGNGIFSYGSTSGFGGNNNSFTSNELYNNRKGGFFTKMRPDYVHVTDNKIWGNGQGGIILRCMASNNHFIEDNDVSDNYGDGIYIGGNYNTVRDNTVRNNIAGHRVGDTCVEDGDGIDMGRNDGSSDNTVYNNTICGNEGNGIHIVSGVSGNSLSGNIVCENGAVDIYDGDATIGADNTCDTTHNYVDTGTTNCRYNCSAVSMPDIDLIPIIPDKIIMSASAIDQPNDIEVTIENSGSNGAGPFNVTLLSEAGATIDIANVSALGGGETTEVNLAWTPPAVGNYTLMVYVDFPPKDGGVIEETNEANNIANVKIQVEEETVPTPTPEEEQPAFRSGGGGGGGSRRIAGGEDIFGYEPSTGAGTEEEIGGEETKEVPVNESKTVKEEQKMGTGHPFGEGETIETVKVLAPVFLVVALITIVIVLFYLGYHKEKKMHRRRR
ncbi:Serine protease, subtilase family [Candidatus Methanophagaceae archaeon]|nr:Serine protease, subtilase family [Methanophagales archaeon]